MSAWIQLCLKPLDNGVNSPFRLSQWSFFLDICSKTVLIKHKEFKDRSSCLFFLSLTDQIIYNTEKNVAPLPNSPIGATLRAEQRKNDGKVWTHDRTDSGPTFPIQSSSSPSPVSLLHLIKGPLATCGYLHYNELHLGQVKNSILL